MLRRAGYVRGDGEFTALGRQAIAHLEELLQIHPSGEFFRLLQLPVLAAEIGEFYYPLAAGKDEVIRCESCGYTAPRELALFRKTPGSTEAALPLEKVLTPECNTIDSLAQYLGMPKEKTAKALMYTRDDGKFVFVVMRGDMQASESKLRQQVGNVRAATHEEILGAGAAPGYASPIGLKEALIVVDDLIPVSTNLVAGANEAGYHLKNTNYGRDYSAQLVADLALAEPGAACPTCGQPLSVLSADILCDAAGCRMPNIVEALADAHHDEKGLTLPASAAPFTVYLLHLAGKELDTRAKAQEFHDDWEAAGVRTLYDDRDERAGVKFADADLIGCPIRVTVGERGMREGMVELKERTRSELTPVPFADALATIQSLAKKTP
jgi:prolyl-tRNA synthetase